MVIVAQVFHVTHRETGESFAVKRSTKRLVSKAHREKYGVQIAYAFMLPLLSAPVVQKNCTADAHMIYIEKHYITAAAEFTDSHCSSVSHCEVALPPSTRMDL